MEGNSSLEGEMHVLEADTCPPLVICPSPVSFHLPSDLHVSLERSSADQNDTFKQPGIDSNSGKCTSSKEMELTSQERKVQQAEPATCPAEPSADCSSPFSPRCLPRLIRSLDKSNVAQDGTAEWPATMSSCGNSSSCKGSSNKMVKLSSEGELQTVGLASGPITKCLSSITRRRSVRLVAAVENQNGGQNSIVKKSAIEAECRNSNLNGRSKKVKLSTGEKDLQILEINQDNRKENGDNACFFVGEAVPDEEARRRWPHHYVEKVIISYSLFVIVFTAVLISNHYCC